MDELELMRRVAGGDSEAMTRLVDSHYDAIYRFLRHVSGSREDAQDFAQDVFLIARSKGRSFSGGSSVRTWLTRVALNEWRRGQRRARLAALWTAKASPDVRRDDEILDAEWLLEGLSQLKDEHRVALLLYEVHGFSVKEVAEITHSPEGTVKARLHYARQRLRQILICPQEEPI